MDIASFILGMCSVVVAIGFAVTVYTLVKMKRQMKEFRNNIDVLTTSIDTIVNEYRDADTVIDLLMNEQFEKLYRNLDSRFDKCMHKITALELNYRGRAYDRDRAFDKSPVINPQNPKDWYEPGPSSIPQTWMYNPGPTCSTENNEETN